MGWNNRTCSSARSVSKFCLTGATSLDDTEYPSWHCSLNALVASMKFLMSSSTLTKVLICIVQQRVNGYGAEVFPRTSQVQGPLLGCNTGKHGLDNTLLRLRSEPKRKELALLRVLKASCQILKWLHHGLRVFLVPEFSPDQSYSPNSLGLPALLQQTGNQPHYANPRRWMNTG